MECQLAKSSFAKVKDSITNIYTWIINSNAKIKHLLSLKGCLTNSGRNIKYKYRIFLTLQLNFSFHQYNCLHYWFDEHFTKTYTIQGKLRKTLISKNTFLQGRQYKLMVNSWKDDSTAFVIYHHHAYQNHKEIPFYTHHDAIIK